VALPRTLASIGAPYWSSDSFAQAIAAHDSPGYQAALAVLGMWRSATFAWSKTSEA
jgi:hypothetical protein